MGFKCRPNETHRIKTEYRISVAQLNEPPWVFQTSEKGKEKIRVCKKILFSNDSRIKLRAINHISK